MIQRGPREKQYGRWIVERYRLSDGRELGPMLQLGGLGRFFRAEEAKKLLEDLKAAMEDMNNG